MSTTLDAAPEDVHRFVHGFEANFKLIDESCTKCHIVEKLDAHHTVSPCPGADVTGVSPGPGADVTKGEPQSRRRCDEG